MLVTIGIISEGRESLVSEMDFLAVKALRELEQQRHDARFLDAFHCVVFSRFDSPCCGNASSKREGILEQTYVPDYKIL